MKESQEPEDLAMQFATRLHKQVAQEDGDATIEEVELCAAGKLESLAPERKQAVLDAIARGGWALELFQELLPSAPPKAAEAPRDAVHAPVSVAPATERESMAFLNPINTFLRQLADRVRQYLRSPLSEDLNVLRWLDSRLAAGLGEASDF